MLWLLPLSDSAVLQNPQRLDFFMAPLLAGLCLHNVIPVLSFFPFSRYPLWHYGQLNVLLDINIISGGESGCTFDMKGEADILERRGGWFGNV